MMPRFMAMMALAFSVSGCATGDDPAVLYTGSIKPVGPPLIADVSPDYAAAYLPPVAGRVEAVRQSSRPDQIDQSILYSNAGYLAARERTDGVHRPCFVRKVLHQGPDTARDHQ
ncbi:hypothetical protein OEG86_04475 [Hoeflea alexandrii]|uniref:hypothetical protein n=1 Tax=Hoeflea alexandrii TaxID=288436 RepID=UPI00226E4B12|nr:hypothetical protein [Hoeflea alexandrii]MCY0151615.1 hypothetical protein [Hoeflea alexandrii]